MTPEAEALVLDHLQLVERIARGVAKRMPACIEMDELVAAGNVGLVEAASKYRPELNPSFPFFAFQFVRGRMIDAYRGRNYPRLTESLPEDADQRLHLLDPAPNPEELVVAEEEQAMLVVDIEFAKRRLTLVEKRVVQRHLDGQPMRAVGATEKRSGAWAHYTIHRARRKLREALGDYEQAA